MLQENWTNCPASLEATQIRFVPYSGSLPGFWVIIDGAISYQETSLTFLGRNLFFRHGRSGSETSAGRTKMGTPTGGKLATIRHRTPQSWPQFEFASQWSHLDRHFKPCWPTWDERDPTSGCTLTELTSKIIIVCSSIKSTGTWSLKPRFPGSSFTTRIPMDNRHCTSGYYTASVTASMTQVAVLTSRSSA